MKNYDQQVSISSKRKKNGNLLAEDYRKLAAMKRDREMAIAEAEYKKYIHRKQFRNLREQCLIRDNYQCQFCGRTAEELKEKGKYLQCHHRSYQHLGQGGEDELNDVITVCDACHRGAHQILANKGRFKDKRCILQYLNIDLKIGPGDTIVTNDTGETGIVLSTDDHGGVVLINHGETETWMEYDNMYKIKEVEKFNN